MSTQKRNQGNHIKSLIDDLEERIYELKHFDAASEVNSHCDDLVGQVMLTIESAMKHLTKVQTRMVNEINDYRKDLLDAQDSSGEKQSPAHEEFKKLSQEIAAFKSNATASVASRKSAESIKKANDLKERTNHLRKQMRVNAFDGKFMRFLENDGFTYGTIGRLLKTQKDVQDDYAIQSVDLDELASSSQVSTLFATDSVYFQKNHATAVLYLEDGNIVIGTRDHSLYICDPELKTALLELTSTEHEGCITALVQLPNGYLVTGDDEGYINVWDLENRQHLYAMDVKQEILYLKVTSNGKLACCARNIYVWNLDVFTEEAMDADLSEKEQVVIPLDLSSFFDQVKARSVLRDDNETTYLSKQYKLVDYSGRKSLDSSTVEDIVQDLDWVNMEVCFEALSNGHLAFSYLKPSGTNINIWNSETGHYVKGITILGDDIESCTILPDGDAVICHEDNKVEIYSLEEDKIYQAFQNHYGPIVAIRAHQSRRSLMFVHLEDTQLPFLSEGQTQDLFSPWLAVSCFSKDGQQMAAGFGNEKLVIWPLKD